MFVTHLPTPTRLHPLFNNSLLNNTIYSLPSLQHSLLSSIPLSFVHSASRYPSSTSSLPPTSQLIPLPPPGRINPRHPRHRGLREVHLGGPGAQSRRPRRSRPTMRQTRSPPPKIRALTAKIREFASRHFWTLALIFLGIVGCLPQVKTLLHP